MVAAVAVSTDTVVVLQLIRGNAIAHAIRNRNGVSCCKMAVTKLAVQSHSTDHAAKTMGSETRMTLLLRQPAHAAERQLEAIRGKAEEQCVDLLKVISEPKLSWSYLEKVIDTATVYSRLFEFSPR